MNNSSGPNISNYHNLVQYNCPVMVLSIDCRYTPLPISLSTGEGSRFRSRQLFVTWEGVRPSGWKGRKLANQSTIVNRLAKRQENYDRRLKIKLDLAEKNHSCLALFGPLIHGLRVTVSPLRATWKEGRSCKRCKLSAQCKLDTHVHPSINWFPLLEWQWAGEWPRVEEKRTSGCSHQCKFGYAGRIAFNGHRMVHISLAHTLQPEWSQPSSHNHSDWSSDESRQSSGKLVHELGVGNQGVGGCLAVCSSNLKLITRRCHWWRTKTHFVNLGPTPYLCSKKKGY